MKKIVYIGILFLALVATSCQKEEIITVVNEDSNAPVWNGDSFSPKSGGSDQEADSDEQDTPDEPVIVNPKSIQFIPPPAVSGGTPIDITDPNNDPDGKKRKI